VIDLCDSQTPGISFSPASYLSLSLNLSLYLFLSSPENERGGREGEREGGGRRKREIPCETAFQCFQ
jgi:hypothetical protein